jgi:hypothetical protein
MNHETFVFLSNMTGPQMYEFASKLARLSPAACEELAFNLDIASIERRDAAAKEADAMNAMFNHYYGA